MNDTATATAQAPTSKRAPDPEMNPVGYLLHHNWAHEGNPKSRTTKWFDPTKSRTAKSEKVLKMSIKDKKTGKVEETWQEQYTPPAWGMTRDEAVQVQMERDEAALSKKAS